MTSHRLSLFAAAVAVAAVLPLAYPASAQGLPPQPNPITSPVPAPEAKTFHAKVTAINAQAGTVGLAGANGQKLTLKVAPTVDLSQLKVGDIVNAKYYRSVVFVVSTPGAPVPENEIIRVTAQPVRTAGDDVLQLTRITATVVGIDLAAHSVDVVDPSGGAVRTVVVTDPARIAALPKLKVGDNVTVVVSQALLVNLTPVMSVGVPFAGEQPDAEDPNGGR
jgi:hypothetical protein